MLLGLLEGHPLVSLLQKIVDEAPQIGTVLVPLFFVVNYEARSDILDCIGMIFRLKGSIVSNNFVDGDSQSPQVNPFVIAASNKYLRRHVEMSANNGQHVSPLPPQKGLL
jgi:hypothetical protein